MPANNVDAKTVEGFGQEWTRFDQAQLEPEESRILFESYFRNFPWDALPKGAVGFDMGCGSGRWAKFVAPRVGKLFCVDPSEAALQVARRNLREASNCDFILASADSISFADNTMDFGYSLGVLHHVPDTSGALRSCVRRLKPGAPFLVYLYYALENRPRWFRLLWRASDLLRRYISALPFGIKNIVAQLIAGFIYFPLARLALVLERLGFTARSLPLAAYRRRSFYTMRTDALDRFGTRLEKRFTRDQIGNMMKDAGLENIRFTDSEPYWCAVGFKREPFRQPAFAN